MNEKCKYCNYVSKCSQYCEYNSVICKLHRSFPKVVDKSYEELQQENQELQKRINTAIEEIKYFDYFKGNYKDEDDFDYPFLYVMKEEIDRVLDILEKGIDKEVE